MMIDSEEHKAVLQKESVKALVTDADGEYVDCTYGRGGHTAEILEYLSPRGRLLVIDKDLQAIEHAHRHYGSEGQVTAVHGSFADLQEHTRAARFGSLSGVLMDLGVSSPQLENGSRGFSFTRDGPLDMRMDQTVGATATEWLSRVKETDLIHVLRKYGEEKFARRHRPQHSQQPHRLNHRNNRPVGQDYRRGCPGSRTKQAPRDPEFSGDQNLH